jgi:hypothetical protein
MTRTHHLSKVSRFLILVLMLLAPSCTQYQRQGISISQPTPTSETIVIEDSGEVCIQPQSSRMNISVRADKCFSGTIDCTAILEQSGAVNVDRNHFTIRLHSRFVVQASNQGCDMDCNHMSIAFNLFAMPLGTYSVWLGKSKLGEVNTSDGVEPSICFTTNPPIPTATYSGPTATPWPLSPLITPTPHP